MEGSLFRFILVALCIALVSGAGGGMSSSAKESGTGGDTDTTKTLRVGGTLTLACKLGNPEDQLEISWSKDGEMVDENERIAVVNNSLVIKDAVMEDIGRYKCTSSVLPSAFDVSVVYLSYKKMSKSVTVFQGDHFSLTCDVEGNPAPKVEWFKDQVALDQFDKSENTSHFELRPNGKEVEGAVLYFDSAEYIDRGEFMCKITSGSIYLNTTTYVRVKDMYAALWPFLGICAEVIILCIIIFVYERNRMKNDVDESDTDQPNDQKNSGLNKDSLRHRK